MRTWMVVVVAACSSKDPQTPDARPGDAPVAHDTAPTADAAAATCGAGPYVAYSASVVVRALDGSTPPLAGVAVHVDECPSLALTTDATGAFAFDDAKTSMTTIRLDKAGYIPVILAQFDLSHISDSFADMISLRLASDWATPAHMPGFDSAHGYLVIGLGTDAGSGACNKPDGATVSLPTHPEAVVHYMTGFPPTENPALTGADATGVVYVSGITPGHLTPDEVVLTKAGCKSHPDATGFVVAAGAMTRTFLTLDPP